MTHREQRRIRAKTQIGRISANYNSGHLNWAVCLDKIDTRFEVSDTKRAIVSPSVWTLTRVPPKP